MPAEKWRLLGYDTFAGEEYPLPGEYDSESEAVSRAMKRLEELEKLQPSSSSGGQDGIQDRVYVRRPDGTVFRVRADAN
jgi:hypothetical protein